MIGNSRSLTTSWTARLGRCQGKACRHTGLTLEAILKIVTAVSGQLLTVLHPSE